MTEAGRNRNALELVEAVLGTGVICGCRTGPSVGRVGRVDTTDVVCEGGWLPGVFCTISRSAMSTPLTISSFRRPPESG